ARLIVYWSLAAAGLTLAVLPLVMALRDITVAYSRLSMAQHGVSVAARRSGKIKAWVQGLGAIFLLLGPLHVGWSSPGSVVVASWLVLLVTAASAIEYVAAAVRSSSP
ncbi:MAG: CDP-alcohol phosphatidyltransferase family protein, partial [Acidobacteriota bacterium]